MARAGDPSASHGVPAHVTLLYPFLPWDRVDAGVLAELAWFFRGVDAFDVRFTGVGEFAADGVLYLDPEGGSLDDLAGALARRWPETPPYGGAVDRPYAHLTVLRDPDADVRAEAARSLAPALPLQAVAAKAALWACDDDGRWTERVVFDLSAREAD